LRKIISFKVNNRNVVKNIVLLLSFSLLLVAASYSPIGVHDYRVRKVVIDAGHGGKDPGTHGKISKEKDIALKIALELGQTIKKYLPDVEVLYSRTDDSFPSLHERAQFANRNNADLFISIHCNWVANPVVEGTETYVMGLHKSDANFDVAKRENAVILQEENSEVYEGFDPNSPESYILFSLTQSAYQQNSLSLASKIEHQFKTRVGKHSRGVKMAGFWVLWETSMPSVLVETGYLSNEKEEKELNDPLQQSYIASGIFRAFRDYKNEIESMN
jgi:N-acetylmuramoyl-L-alanine amidase